MADGVGGLVSFLRARLDEDEADARARRGIWPQPGIRDHGSLWLHVHRSGNAVVTQYRHPVEGYGDMAALRAWATPEGLGFHRDRVLVEVDAKRRILDLWEETHARRDKSPSRQLRASTLDDVLPLLAEPYKDHPDYDPSWRPQ